jgi:TPR repeat protein
MSELAATLRHMADNGDADAQAAFGQMLLDGREVARDAELALHWFRVAAHADHAMAMNMIGRCYELGWGTPIDVDLAAVWYRCAAEKGLDWGMYNYAHALAMGRGVRADRAAAFLLYRRAASLGHAKAMYMVGRFHDEGWETPRDSLLAAQWYRRAAEGGDFRGEANYAAVLAQEGRFDEAVPLLRAAFVTATPEFSLRLVDELARSGVPVMQRLADEYRA